MEHSPVVDTGNNVAKSSYKCKVGVEVFLRRARCGAGLEAADGERGGAESHVRWGEGLFVWIWSIHNALEPSKR